MHPRRLAPSVLAAILATVVTGCGGADGAGGSSAPSAAAQSETPAEPTYYTEADTDALNAVIGPASTAQQQMTRRAAVEACNGLREDLKSWRACWTALVEPAARGLGQASTTVLGQVADDMPQACADASEEYASALKAARKDLERLLQDLTNGKAAVQRRAARDYAKSAEAAGTALTEALPDLTQACYSPADLASIEASPSPTS